MSIPCLRFIKLPDRDAWVPSYVVKKNDDLSAFYILVEFGQSSIASKLLGDAVNLHTIDDKPFVGAWVNKAFKTTWRMSSSTVPHGKALQSSTTLELEDISEAFINDIADPTEPPLPPQQHAFQATGEASASSSSEGVFPYPPMPSHAPPYVAPGPHPHQPVVPQGSHVSTGLGPAVSEGSLPAGSTNPVAYGASEGLNQYQHVPPAEGLPPQHVILPSVNPVLPSGVPMAMNYGYPTGSGAGFPLLPPVPQPPPALGTHGVNFEVPQFAPFSGNNDAIDSTTRHYAKREANSADLPNKRQFTGFNDDRAVADVIKSVNHLSCSNGWGALEYYFFLTRLLDETVSREVRPLPQQTHSACAREVMRICQLLSQLHKSSDTDYIRKLFKWNSLCMGDRQQLGDYLKAFDSIRLDIERQQGYSFEDRFLASKLTASLRGAHHEAALTRMKALTYRQLLHELVELDRLRQLSSHQRGRSDPSQGRKDDPLPKVPLNQMTASTSTTATNQSSTQQPTQGSNGHGKGSHDRQRRQRPKLRCTRCMDGDPNCKAGASLCPAPSPLKKEGRCPYCNRPSVKCTGVCPKRDSVRCDRCSQQHHTSHCPNSLTKSTDPTLDTMTLSLSVESLSFTPPSSTSNGPLKAFSSTTQATTSPPPVIASPVLNLDNTLQSLRDMPSSLRNVEFNFLTKDGRCPGFTGLLDSGSQLLACSDSGLLRLQQANVALEPTGVTCVATLAVSRRVNSCPIYKITYCHKGLRVQTFIALVHGLARDFIFSCDVLRRVQSPVLWVFNPSGDRIISLVDTTPQVATAWKAFIDAVDLSRSAPRDDPPSKVAVGLNSVDFGDTQRPTSLSAEDESCFNKDSVIPLPVADDFSNAADDDLTNGSVSTSFMQLLFSEPCPLVTLASLPVTDTLLVYSDPVPSKQVSTPSPPPHRFVHHLRWRTGHRPTNSHIPFLKRSSALAHQLRRKGLFDAYDAEIRGFVQKGYVKPVPREEVRFWLHHFPVIKKGSQEGSVNRSSMRLRPVFDGSPLSKFIDASLPEGLHQGVPQSLGLLRRYKYFVALDIVQAFLQIELPLVEDQRCLGFFWCNQAFVFQRVCFGMPDSPFAMSDSLAKAMVEADAPTKHVRCLMDDISVGSDDARHLTALRRDITQRLSHRMFETNDKKEVSNLPDQIPSDPQPCLGVRWHPKCDCLSLKSDLRHKASTVTTVKLLKRYGNGFYDPLGWHLELSMQLRLLCRQARSNADPHTGHLRSEDTKALVAWENQLKAFDLRVPRLLRRPGESHCNSVCLFTDSSDTAGAALLYTLHGQRIAGSGYLHQLQGRRTAPKFELDTLASSLEWASAMLQESNDHSPVHHLLVFTDSSISISRLRQVTPTTAHSVEDLVTIRRVLKVKNAIHQLQTRCEGLHVVVSHLSGKSNLADAPSRCQPKSLSIDSDALFCHIRAFHDDLLRCNDGDLQGSPMIFRLDSEYVPTALPTRWSKKESSKPKVTLASLGAATTSSPAGESEKTDQEVFKADDDSLHLLERLYRFKLLVKAWHALRTELLPGTPASSTSAVADPLRLLIRHQQRLYLKAFHKLPFHFKTDEGLIYRSTRQAGDGTIFNQLVIPKQSTLLQRLLVIKCHGWHHGGINATLRRLSTMYAWPRMKRTVVPVCRCCRSCLSAKSQRPLHAPAGTFAAPTAVWQYIGLDHTGPYDVPAREGSQRLPYCLVATCLLSGYQFAVAVSSTSLEQTTLAFKKILALAGVPKGLRCDNSQSFRGSEFRCLCLSYSIEMQFIYSRSPQRGGAYERHHAELNEQLRLLQAHDQPWDLTVLEATARSNARFRWDDSGLVNSPWDLAHTYPYLQCAALSPPVDLTLPKAFQEPSARVSEWLLSTWEKDREGRRVRAGDKAATVNTGDIVYLKLPRRVTKLSSSTTGPFRVLQRCGNSVKLTPTTGANRYRSVFFQPIDNVVRTVSEPVHDSDSDTPLPGPPESHQVPDESIPDKATNAETTASPQVEADSSKALASAQDDAHVNDTPSSALPSKAFTSTTGSSADDTVVHKPSSTSSRPRTKRATFPRCTGDPHPEVKNFAYITSSGRGGLQCGRVISIDQGLYRLQLADRSADGNSIHLRSDMVSSPTAYLLRVQGDSDDFPDNKTDFRLTRASVRFLDNLKMTKR